MAVSIHNNIVSGPEELDIPAHLSYAQFLFDQLKKGGDRVALICGETGNSVTYRDILQQSVNLAVALQKLGLKKGDVVALCSENRFEFPVAALGVMYCGAVLCTLNVTYSPGEISHILKITKPKMIFTSPITAQNIQDCSEGSSVEKIVLFGDYDVIPGLMFKDLIKDKAVVENFDLVDVGGMDTLAVMCSSGTTGLPKGVMLTHINFLTLSRHMKYYIDTSMESNNTEIKNFLALIPWFHAYGFITTFGVMSNHLEIVFLTRFEDKLFLETIQRYKVNMMTLVPPLAVFLAKHPLVLNYDLKSVNEVWCGAAPLSAEIQNAVSQRLGINFIRQGYGLTEVTMACCVDLSTKRRLGSCGTPAPGMKIKVIDIDSGKKKGAGEEGELWIKSPLRMKGYMGDEAASAALVDAEGYVRTGDIGYYDRDGAFYIVDRLKELIKYNGFQVAPAELEALLLQHAGVAEAGVVGAPDERAGELPTAFVVRQPGAAVSQQELVQYVAEKVAPAELEALLLQHAGVAEAGVVGAPDERAGELPTAFVVRQPGAAVSQQELVQYVAEKVSPAKHLRGGVIFLDDIPKNASGKILRRELKALLKKQKKSKL